MIRRGCLLLLVGWTIFGCAPSDPLPLDQIRGSREILLEHYDNHFDADAAMLRVPFSTPGYHSGVEAGSLVHPTRESLVYALALLQRGGPGDGARAADVLRKVVALQDQDEAVATCGIWPWLLEEPIDQMPSPDMNWADFCGATIGQILVEHADQLPTQLNGDLRGSLRLAAEAIRRRDVGPSYTNIAVLGGGVCAVAGEVLDDETLLAYGRKRLQGVVWYTQRHGSFTEYNSPPYVKVVVAECERTLQLVEDDETRAATEIILQKAWQIAAGSFHPATQQWAGPHARTSRNRLRKSTVEFLSLRTGVPLTTHPTMADGEPRGYAVVKPLPCPQSLVTHFQKSQDKFRRVAFIKKDARSEAIVGTTWFSQTACLGSVSTSSFWTQRKPLIGYWKTAADPAVVFRLRFLHDGRDFASMGVRSTQEGPRVESAFLPLAGQGDWHPSLDRPTDGKFHAKDLRIRFELRGSGVASEIIDDHTFALRAGTHRVLIQTRPGRFADQDVKWQTGGSPDRAFVDGVCYAGDEREFDFSTEFPVEIRTEIELTSN